MKEDLRLQDFYSTVAPFYDEDYASLGYNQDIPYYVGLAREAGGPVLEMGCGTGRILLPTARAGHLIHGLDQSESMLAVLKQKLGQEADEVRRRVSLTQGDMRSTRVAGDFSLVTAPFRSVQHLLDRKNQRQWLQNVARHLRPGGKLAFDVFQPDFKMITAPEGPTVAVDRTDPNTGSRVIRTVACRQEPEIQRAHIRSVWKTYDPKGQFLEQSSDEMTLRWFTQGELKNLLELEGFEIIALWGEFDRTPLGKGAHHLIVEAVANASRVS